MLQTLDKWRARLKLFFVVRQVFGARQYDAGVTWKSRESAAR